MAPLRPMPCSIEGCDYSTPLEATDIKAQMDHLSRHVQDAHPENHVPSLEEDKSQGMPVAHEAMEEEEWAEYMSRWTAYKKGLSEETLMESLFQTLNTKLAWKMMQLGFPNNEADFLEQLQKLAMKTNPRCNSLDHLTSSSPAQVLKTLRGEVADTSFSEAATKDALLEEVIFFFIVKTNFNVFTPKLRKLISSQCFLTADDLVAFLQSEDKKKMRPRNRSLSRGRSPCSILKNSSESRVQYVDEERGRKRKREEGEQRMVTRSLSRSQNRSVRIISPTPNMENDFELENTLPSDEPSTGEISKTVSPKQWIWYCKYCGEQRIEVYP